MRAQQILSRAAESPPRPSIRDRYEGPVLCGARRATKARRHAEKKYNNGITMVVAD